MVHDYASRFIKGFPSAALIGIAALSLVACGGGGETITTTIPPADTTAIANQEKAVADREKQQATKGTELQRRETAVAAKEKQQAAKDVAQATKQGELTEKEKQLNARETTTTTQTITPANFAGFSDAAITDTVIAIKEVADNSKIQLTDRVSKSYSRSSKLGIHSHQFRTLPNMVFGAESLLDSKFSKIVPSESQDNISYSFVLYTIGYFAGTSTFSTAYQQSLVDPFRNVNKIFSLENNDAYHFSRKRREHSQLIWRCCKL